MAVRLTITELGDPGSEYVRSFLQDRILIGRTRSADVCLPDLAVWDDPNVGRACALHTQDVLDYLVDRLNLKPWPNVDTRLQELRDAYFDILEVEEL